MSRMNSFIQYVGGVINFPGDAAAVGAYNTMVILPRNAQIQSCQWVSLSQLTSAGASTLSLDLVAVDGAVPYTGIGDLAPTANFNAYFSLGIPVGAGPYVAIASINTFPSANPIKLLTDFYVQLTIGAAAMTGGRAQFVIGYAVTTF
jgi:hypothetical protein